MKKRINKWGGLILRALQGKASIYKAYGYKLTNKNTHEIIYNNDLSLDLNNTHSITLGIFKSILDNAIQLINTFSDNTITFTKNFLEDLAKMKTALQDIPEDKKELLLCNIYENLNPEFQELLINNILFKFISTKIKLIPSGESSIPVQDIFINLFSDNVKYIKKEEIDNYEIKLNFLKSLYKLYYIQKHQVKKLENVPSGGNRTNNYYRSIAGKTLRKSKSRRKSRKN